MENENQQQQQQQQQQQPAPTLTPAEALKALDEKYKAQLQQKDQEMAALMQYVNTKTTPPSGEEEDKKLSPEEQKKHIEQIAKDIAENKINGIEQAKRIIEYDDYMVENGERSIFLASYGTPSAEDVKSAERAKELLKYAIESCDGDESVFQAQIGSKLKDLK